MQIGLGVVVLLVAIIGYWGFLRRHGWHLAHFSPSRPRVGASWASRMHATAPAVHSESAPGGNRPFKLASAADREILAELT